MSIDESVSPSIRERAGRLFEYDLESLSDVGVRISRQQEELLEECISGTVCHALSLTYLVDPSDKYRLVSPLLTWDDELGCERLIAYPTVVRLDWDQMDDEELFGKTLAYEHNWRRFPSLAGFLLPFEVGPMEALSWPELGVFRIWNLWPIKEEDVGAVQDAIETWTCGEAYQNYGTWVDAERGDIEPCDVACYRGRDEEEHEHNTDTSAYWYDRCVTGDADFEELKKEVLIYLEGEELPYVRYFPGPELSGSLAPAWESLLVSSETNTRRSLDAFPPWETESLTASERWFSPWLWLC